MSMNGFTSPFRQEASLPSSSPPRRGGRDPNIPRWRFLEYLSDEGRALETAGPLLSSATQQFYRDLDTERRKTPAKGVGGDGGRGPSPSMLNARTIPCTDVSRRARREAAAVVRTGNSTSTPAASAAASRLSSSLLRNVKFGIVTQNVINRPSEPFESNPFVSYAGDVAEGECHGQGLLVCQDGSSTRGRFIHGELTGTGIRTSEDGSVYEGGFLKGEMHGDHGVENSVEKGEYYEGPFQFNLRQGRGTLITAIKPPLNPNPNTSVKTNTINNTATTNGSINTTTNTSTTHQHPFAEGVVPIGKRVGTRTAYSGLFAKGFPHDDNGLLVVMGVSATVGGFSRGLLEGRGCTVYFPENAPRLAVSYRHRTVPPSVVGDLRALLNERGWVCRNLGGVPIPIPPSNHDTTNNNSAPLPISRELYIGSYHNGLEEDVRGIMVSNQWFQASGADTPFQLNSSGIDEATTVGSDTGHLVDEHELCLAYVGPFSGGMREAVPSLSVPRALTITPPAGCGPDGATPGGSTKPPPSGRVVAILPDPLMPSIAGRYGHPIPLSDYLEKYHPAASGNPTKSIEYHAARLPTPTTTNRPTSNSPPAKRPTSACAFGDSPRRGMGGGGGSLNMSVRSQVSAVISVTRPPTPVMGRVGGGRVAGATAKAAVQEYNNRLAAHSITPYADVFIPVTAGSVLDITLGLGSLLAPAPSSGSGGMEASINDVVMDPYLGYITTPSSGRTTSPIKSTTRPSSSTSTSTHRPTSANKQSRHTGTAGGVVGVDVPPPPPFSHPAARLMAAVGSGGVVEMDVFETNRRMQASLLAVPEGMDPYAVTPSNCEGIIPIIEPGGSDITGAEIGDLDIAKHIASFYETAQDTTGNKCNVCDLDVMVAAVASLNAKGGKGGRGGGSRGSMMGVDSSRKSVMMQRGSKRGSTMMRGSSMGSAAFGGGGLPSPSAGGKPLPSSNSRRSSLGSASVSMGPEVMLGAGAHITQSTANFLFTTTMSTTKASNGVAALFDENAPLTISPLITTDTIHTTIRVPPEVPPPTLSTSTIISNTLKQRGGGKTPLEELVDSAQELGKLYVNSVAQGLLKKRPGSIASMSRSMCSATRRAADLAPLPLDTTLKGRQQSPSLSPRAKLPPHASIRCVIPPTSHIGMNLYVLYVAPVDPTVQLRPGEVPPQQLANPSIAYGDHYDYGERPPPQYLQDQLSYIDAEMVATRAEILALNVELVAPPTFNLGASVRQGGGSKAPRPTRVTLDLPQERYGSNSASGNPITASIADRINQLEASLVSLREAKEALLEEVARPLRTPLGLIRPFILPIRITHPTKLQQSAIAAHVELWAASTRGKSPGTRSEDAATVVGGDGEEEEDPLTDEDGDGSALSSPR